MTTYRWVPTEGATPTERDQEVDLGNGWHAIVGPDSDGRWTWEIWDRWLHDDDAGVVALGVAIGEGTAKREALDAYEALTESHAPDKVEA